MHAGLQAPDPIPMPGSAICARQHVGRGRVFCRNGEGGRVFSGQLEGRSGEGGHQNWRQQAHHILTHTPRPWSLY